MPPMPSVAVHNGRYVEKIGRLQTISRAISWRLVIDLQSGVPARDRLRFCVSVELSLLGSSPYCIEVDEQRAAGSCREA